MKTLLQYIKFELKRFFKNTKLVVIFLFSPLLATAVFALFAYQSPRDINIALVNSHKNELSEKIEAKIDKNGLFIVHKASDVNDGKAMLKAGSAKTSVILDIENGEGEVRIIEDPRYPEIQGKVKEEISDSIKDILKEAVASQAEETAREEYQKTIDQKFAEFTDKILGQGPDTSLSKTINQELDKIKEEVVLEINLKVDSETEENLETSKNNLSEKLSEEIKVEFDSFLSKLIAMLPPGEIANTISSQMAGYQTELVEKIKETISSETSSQMAEFQKNIKQELTATVDKKFAAYKNRLSPSNPESPIYKAIEKQVNDFKTELQENKIDIVINAEPIKMESNEYLPKEIKYFDRYSSGAIPLVIVLIFLLKAATSFSEDRESGVLERLFSTPASRFKVMIAKIISNVLIGVFSLIAIILMLRFAFDAAIGSWLLVFLISFIMAIVSVSMGLLISVITRDLPSSIQFAFYTFFMIVLSSEFFFASENIHPYFRYASKINPLTYAISALRKVNLFDWGIADIWVELVILVVFAVVYTTSAVILVNRETK